MIRAILCTTILSTAALVAPAAPALGAPQGSAAGADHAVRVQLAKEDRDFFDDAAQGGLLEVKLGQLAIKQAASDEVKHFAQRMIDDHTKLNQRLVELGQKEGLSVPAELDKKHQDKLDKLAHLSGSKLDQEYIGDMVSDHEADVKAFEKEEKDGKDAGLKLFAGSSLPLLNEHLTQAKQIHEHLKR
jgi:putative membrane protein